MFGGTYYGTNYNGATFSSFEMRSNVFLSNVTITNDVVVTPGGNPYTLLSLFGDGIAVNDVNMPITVLLDNVFLRSHVSSGTDTALSLTGGSSVWLNRVHAIADLAALDTRGVKLNANNCTFETYTNGSICYSPNDDSTNFISNSTFLGNSSGGGGSCIIQWVRSKTTYTNCFFGMHGLAGDSVIHLSEDPSIGVFTNCVFNLTNNSSTHVCDLISFDSDGYTIELNNCIVLPPTNGVIVDNTVGGGHLITVRGGNIVPGNFKDPSKVFWGNSGANLSSIIQSNLFNMPKLTNVFTYKSNGIAFRVVISPTTGLTKTNAW